MGVVMQLERPGQSERAGSQARPLVFQRGLGLVAPAVSAAAVPAVAAALVVTGLLVSRLDSRPGLVVVVGLRLVVSSLGSFGRFRGLLRLGRVRRLGSRVGRLSGLDSRPGRFVAGYGGMQPGGSVDEQCCMGGGADPGEQQRPAYGTDYRSAWSFHGTGNAGPWASRKASADGPHPAAFGRRPPHERGGGTSPRGPPPPTSPPAGR